MCGEPNTVLCNHADLTLAELSLQGGLWQARTIRQGRTGRPGSSSIRRPEDMLVFCVPGASDYDGHKQHSACGIKGSILERAARLLTCTSTSTDCSHSCRLPLGG